MGLGLTVIVVSGLTLATVSAWMVSSFRRAPTSPALVGTVLFLSTAGFMDVAQGVAVSCFGSRRRRE